ncbi:hypothetical protein ACFLZX_03080 [Nanoarchaeota archaeon]
MVNVYFETHGCSANLSESEGMVGLLEKSGFIIVNDITKSDVVVINSCTVKGEEKMVRIVKKLIELHPQR